MHVGADGSGRAAFRFSLLRANEYSTKFPFVKGVLSTFFTILRKSFSLAVARRVKGVDFRGVFVYNIDEKMRPCTDGCAQGRRI